MHSLVALSVSDLPPPPPQRAGWPWTVNAPRTIAFASNRDLPRVTIVTPSYNQVEYIEETIRSVLLQGYPNLEYMVIDGGSTDDSTDIIRKYEPWLAYWVSEPDRGQSHAINKGWRSATGDILAWLNSDDLYQPGTLERVASCFVGQQHPHMVYGDCYMIDERGNLIHYNRSREFHLRDLLRGNFIAQPSTFLSKSRLTEVGMLDETLDLCLDYDLWLRAGDNAKVVYLPVALSRFRSHPASKTSTQYARMAVQSIAVAQRFMDVSTSFQGSKEKYGELLAEALLGAGLALWLAGQKNSAPKYIQEIPSTARNLFGENVAIRVARQAEQPNVASTLEELDTFFGVFPKFAFLKRSAEAWALVLAAQKSSDLKTTLLLVRQSLMRARSPQLIRTNARLIIQSVIGQTRFRTLRSKITHTQPEISS